MNTSAQLENGDSLEFWKGVREGVLRFQKCRVCGTVQFPPRHHCATCWEADLAWITSNGRGKIESKTIVRRAPNAAFKSKVPYVVAAILVEDGPRMITNIIGEDSLDAEIGDSVEVTFASDEVGNSLPQFKRSSSK